MVAVDVVAVVVVENDLVSEKTAAVGRRVGEGRRDRGRDAVRVVRGIGMSLVGCGEERLVRGDSLGLRGSDVRIVVGVFEGALNQVLRTTRRPVMESSLLSWRSSW